MRERGETFLKGGIPLITVRDSGAASCLREKETEFLRGKLAGGAEEIFGEL